MKPDLNNPFLYKSDKDCCGCAACMNVCPQNAISMEKRENGFCFPIINPLKCVGCNSCIRVCNYKSAANHLEESIATFVAMNSSNDIIASSASGGAFSAFAETILSNGGLVFGCAMTKKGSTLETLHICIETIKDLHLLQGSKYVQSNINNIYQDVKVAIDTKKPVLFSGTPCQIDGVCHNCNSPQSICNYVHFLRNSSKPGRIIVILVGENLGY